MTAVTSCVAAFNVEEELAAFLADTSRTELKMPPMAAGERRLAKAAADRCPGVLCESFGMGAERYLHVFKQQTVLEAPDKISVKNTFIDGWIEGEDAVEPVVFRSTPVQLPKASMDATTAPAFLGVPSLALKGGLDLSPIGEATPKWPREETPSTGTDGGSGKASFSLGPLHDTKVNSAGLPTLLEKDFKVRNTFIHLEEETQAQESNRTVQSMPHDMFRQCLAEELAARAATTEAGVARKAAGEPAEAISATATKPDEGVAPAVAPVAPASPPQVAEAPAAPAQVAEAPSQVALQTFSAGAHVVIRGLTKIPAFNGQSGIVEKFDESTGRYSVRLTNVAPGMPKTAKVKADNLLAAEAVAPPAPPRMAPGPILGTPGKQLDQRPAYFSPMRLGGC